MGNKVIGVPLAIKASNVTKKKICEWKEVLEIGL